MPSSNAGESSFPPPWVFHEEGPSMEKHFWHAYASLVLFLRRNSDLTDWWLWGNQQDRYSSAPFRVPLRICYRQDHAFLCFFRGMGLWGTPFQKPIDDQCGPLSEQIFLFKGKTSVISLDLKLMPVIQGAFLRHKAAIFVSICLTPLFLNGFWVGQRRGAVVITSPKVTIINTQLALFPYFLPSLFANL